MITQDQRQQLYARYSLSPEEDAAAAAEAKRQQDIASLGDVLSATATAEGSGYGYQRDSNYFQKMMDQARSDLAAKREGRFQQGTALNALDQKIDESNRQDTALDDQLRNSAKGREVSDANIQKVKDDAQLGRDQLKQGYDQFNRELAFKYLDLDQRKELATGELLAKANERLEKNKQLNSVLVMPGMISTGETTARPEDIHKIKTDLLLANETLNNLDELGAMDAPDEFHQKALKADPEYMSKFSQALLFLKDKYKLGALTGADQDLLNAVLGGSPEDLKNIVASNPKVLSTISRLANTVASDLINTARAHGYKPDPNSDIFKGLNRRDGSIVRRDSITPNIPFSGGSSGPVKTTYSQIPAFKPSGR